MLKFRSQCLHFVVIRHVYFTGNMLIYVGASGMASLQLTVHSRQKTI